MMNIKQYHTVPEFFDGFLKELNIKQSQLAKKLNVTSTTISKIRKEKMNISDELLLKMCDLFQLNPDDFFNLKRNTRDNKLASHKTQNDSKIIPNEIDIIAETKRTDINSVITDPKVEPDIIALIEKVNSLKSDQDKRKLIKELNGLVDTRIYSSIERYTFRDLKDVLINIRSWWTKSAKQPGYHLDESNKEEFKVELQGYLEKSNESFFFSLYCDMHYLTITTRHQDRGHIEELLKIIPGYYTSDSGIGSLGKLFSNIPVFNMRVFNLSELTKEMKIIFSNLGVPLKNIQFEESRIEPYFDY